MLLESYVMKIGKFQVIGNLGMGANSSILHIRRSSDSRQYALKVVPISGNEDLKFLTQARHEFRVSRMLDHRNLIKIFALEGQRDWLFRVRKVLLLIEYVNGQTLDTIKQLPVPKLADRFLAEGPGALRNRPIDSAPAFQIDFCPAPARTSHASMTHR